MRELEEFQNRILSAFKPSPGRGGDGQESLTSAEWTPLVNVAEDDAEYLIAVELPEVPKENVRVTLENGVLTVTGERKFENEENKKYHLIERSYGRFVRSFSLPGDGDAAKVDAQFKNGVLQVRVAKSEAARPKQIEVRVA
jgi:HSP20 family protein